MGTSPPHFDPEQISDRIGAMATDAASVAVGLGILGVNRLQSLRRDAAARIAHLVDTARSDTERDAGRSDTARSEPPARRSE